MQLITNSTSNFLSQVRSLKIGQRTIRASATHTPPPEWYISAKTNTLLVIIKKRVVAKYRFSII